MKELQPVSSWAGNRLLAGERANQVNSALHPIRVAKSSTRFAGVNLRPT